MASERFCIGDVVILKSGGCYMTVIDFDTSHHTVKYIVAFATERGAFTLTVYGNAIAKAPDGVRYDK